MDFSKIKLFSKEGSDFTMEDLLKDVYVTSKKRSADIEDRLDKLTKEIKTKSDYAVVGITMTEQIKAILASDDQLVKLAQVVQRLAVRNVNEEGELGLSESERAQLIEQAEKLVNAKKYED